ncbi:hypothetical protein [Haladaptatus sp. T7]|uniref:hypothetical protein n=1 Tax=Haladaptatus sp. T7 TaxID=2029368 RepID=UPI0021A2547A|nr:hypothetical protein [Haladaptatus sp. T7]GKZ13859.1 hypothetical protein HAL_17400 [Haladaptatus sp. T7]
MSSFDRIPSPRALLLLLFMGMLALAAFTGLTDSDAARKLLRVFIPVAGVLFAVSVARDAQSRPEFAAVLVLGASCVVGLSLELAGGGVFSNLYVNVAIIGSGLGIRATTLRREEGSHHVPTTTETTNTDTDFWDDPKSALPDAESVLIVALVVVGTVVFLDASGFHTIANIEEALRSDPLDFVWPVALAVGAKVVSVLTNRVEESGAMGDE